MNEELHARLDDACRRIENLERVITEVQVHFCEVMRQTVWTRPLDAADHFRQLEDHRRLAEATMQFERMWRPE